MDEEHIDIQDRRAQEAEDSIPNELLKRSLLPLDVYLRLPMGARLEMAKYDNDVE